MLFDLLTALLDSWTVWNAAAGSEAAGRAWRAEYLRLTYGCGAYVAYEQLVQQAADKVGLPRSAPAALEAHWDDLPAWDGARGLLAALRPHCRLAVVTNCSRRLGHRGRALLGIDWDVVVTSGGSRLLQARPRPYRLALDRLGVRAGDAAFVAGSGYDMFGTSATGLRSFWHNRVGLALPEGAPAPEQQAPTLAPALPWLQSFARGTR